jgi:hypothetical protein
MTNERARLVVVVVAVLVAAATTAAVGATEYDIQVDGSVAVPDRTVEQDGDRFTVTAIGLADPGESVTVDVTAPEGESVEVYLYNADRQIVTSREGTGSGSFSVDLGGYAAGTYTFVLQHDGVREAAHPLVIRGYSVDVSSPGSVTEGDSLRVSVDAAKLRGDDLSNVEVVVADATTTVRRDATRSDDGTYGATVDTAALGPGTYRVYANVRGTDTALGQAEILGLADPARVAVESDSGSTNGGGSAGTDPTSTATPSATPTAGTPTPTPSATGTPTSTSTATGTPTDGDDGSTATADGSGTVVTPREGTATPDGAGQTTTGSAPTHVPVVLGVVAAAIALLGRLRRDR